MNYRIVERDAFQIVGLKRECRCGEQAGPDIPAFWAEVNAGGTADKLTRLLNGEIQGLIGVNRKYDAEKGTMEYWIAAEHAGDVPEGFLSCTFPPAKWIVFDAVGPVPDSIVLTFKRIFSEWLPANGYMPAGLPSIEAYTSPDLCSADSRNEIWLAVK